MSKNKYEENIIAWEKWCEKHGYTPKRHSEDEKENRMAANLSKVYCKMKKRA